VIRRWACKCLSAFLVAQSLIDYPTRLLSWTSSDRFILFGQLGAVFCRCQTLHRYPTPSNQADLAGMMYCLIFLFFFFPPFPRDYSPPRGRGRKNIFNLRYASPPRSSPPYYLDNADHRDLCGEDWEELRDDLRRILHRATKIAKTSPWEASDPKTCFPAGTSHAPARGTLPILSAYGGQPWHFRRQETPGVTIKGQRTINCVPQVREFHYRERKERGWGWMLERE